MDEPTDLYQDMEKLNMLYEELMWDCLLYTSDAADE